MVVFKFDKRSNKTYNGIITGSWTSAIVHSPRIYSISCMDFGMNSYSLNEEYIIKKIA